MEKILLCMIFVVTSVFRTQANSSPDHITCQYESYLGSLHFGGGGIGHSVLVENFLYVSSGGGIKVVDVSDPEEIDYRFNVFQVNTGEEDVRVIEPLAMTNEECLVTLSEDGLVFLDVSDPSQPRYINRYISTTNPDRAVVFGNQVYLITDKLHIGTLEIIDVEDPNNPKRLGVFEFSRHVLNFATDGKIAAVLLSDSQIQIFDISFPESIKHLSTIKLPGPIVRDLHLNDRYLYIAGADLFQVFDIEDPEYPEMVNSEDTDDLTFGMYQSSQFLFLQNATGIRVYHLADPSNPDYVTTYDAALFSNLSHAIVQAMLIDEHGVAYLMTSQYPNSSNSYVRTLDLSTLHRPATEIAIEIEERHSDLNAIGEYIYATGQYGVDRALSVYSIDEQGMLYSIMTLLEDRSPSNLIVDDSLGVVRLSSPQSFGVIDISNPASPSLVAEISYEEGGSQGFSLYQSTLYLVDYEFGLNLFDLADPDNPSLTTSIPYEGYSTGVWVSGSMMALGRIVDNDSQLELYQLSENGAPELLYTFLPSPSYISQVQFHEDEMWIIRWNEKPALVYDIQDPRHPVSVLLKQEIYEHNFVLFDGGAVAVGTKFPGITYIHVYEGASLAEMQTVATLDVASAGLPAVVGRQVFVTSSSDIVYNEAKYILRIDLAGSECVSCIADLNLDEHVDATDILLFIGFYFDLDVHADFTNDGIFDFFDISAFLQAFAAGCP